MFGSFSFVPWSLRVRQKTSLNQKEHLRSLISTLQLTQTTSDLQPCTLGPRTRTPPCWTSDLRPSTSSHRPQTSDLASQCSDLRPHTSHLRVQTSDLRAQTIRPQTSTLEPQTSKPQTSTSELRSQTSDLSYNKAFKDLDSPDSTPEPIACVSISFFRARTLSDHRVHHCRQHAGGT